MIYLISDWLTTFNNNNKNKNHFFWLIILFWWLLMENINKIFMNFFSNSPYVDWLTHHPVSADLRFFFIVFLFFFGIFEPNLMAVTPPLPRGRGVTAGCRFIFFYMKKSVLDFRGRGGLKGDWSWVPDFLKQIKFHISKGVRWTGDSELSCI